MRLASQADRAGKRVGRLRAAGEIEIHDAPLGISDAQFNRSAILHLILRSLFVRGRINFPSQFAANTEHIAG